MFKVFKLQSNERIVDIQGYLTYGQKADDTITLQI